MRNPTLLWGPLPCHGNPRLAMETPTLPWRPLPCHGDFYPAMGTPTLPLRPLPCYGDLHIVMGTLPLTWGPPPCHGDTWPAVGTPTLSWQPFPGHRDPHPVVPLLTASLSPFSLSRARACPRGHQRGGPDARGHWEGTEPVWPLGSTGLGVSLHSPGAGPGVEVRTLSLFLEMKWVPITAATPVDAHLGGRAPNAAGGEQAAGWREAGGTHIL